MAYHLINNVIVMRDGVILDNPFYKRKLNSRVITWLIKYQSEVKKYISRFFNNQRGVNLDDAFSFVLDYFLTSKNRDFKVNYFEDENYSIESYIYYLLSNHILKSYAKLIYTENSHKQAILDESEKSIYFGVTTNQLITYDNYNLEIVNVSSDFEELVIIFNKLFKVNDKEFIFDFFFYSVLNNQSLSNTIKQLSEKYEYPLTTYYKELKKESNAANVMYTLVKNISKELLSKGVTKEELVKRKEC